MTTAFKWGAFQLDAFQIDAEVLGPCAGQDYVEESYAIGYVCGFADSAQPAQGGAVSRSKRPRKRAIVEVDGKTYSVPVDGLQEFFDSIREQAKVDIPVAVEPKKVKRIAKGKAVKPVIKVISAPQEELDRIKSHVDRTNKIMADIWQRTITRYLEDIEEEEWLLMML